MKRFKSKKIQTSEEDSRKSSATFTEEQEANLLKLLSEDLSVRENITKCVRILFLKYQYNYEQQFYLFKKIEDFGTVFKNVQLQPDKPIFVICDIQKKQWILFFFVKRQNHTYMYFKNPSGSLVSFILEKKIKEKFSDLTITSHAGQELVDENDDKNYGSLTVRNLKICLESYQKDGSNFLKHFEEVKFTKPGDVYEDKFTLVVRNTKELAKNDKFKLAFQDFINSLPIGLNELRDNYTKVLEEERDKPVKDQEKIRKAKEAYLEEAKNFNENNNFDKEFQNSENKDEVVVFGIEKDFPEEMKKVTSIFEILDEIVINQQLYAVLRNMCEILNLDYSRLKFLYELKSKKSKPSPSEEADLVADDITDLIKNPPKIKKGSGSKSNNTPFGEILQEVVLGKDGDVRSEEQIQQIKNKYDLVKSKYEEIKKKDLKSIKEWATAKRGYLKDDDNDICEAVAMADQALYLWKGGWRLRDPQVLAVLIFLHHNGDQGRLCQIQTGEGKTLIVAVLAIVKALQGYTVDVITSNEVLAKEGLKENKVYYSIFNLTAATNNISDGKIGYKANILYGTISNFQFDFLRESFEGYNLRKGRKFGVVILDEVDSMLVDNGGHIAKISTPYPGMECLRYIYIMIWQELNKAEENFIEETQEKVIEVVKKSADEGNNKHLEDFLQELLANERQMIKEKVKKNISVNYDLVPKHLRDYVGRKLDVWIKNAVYAKYSCHEHQQYRITTNRNGEDLITPVDFMNTGVTLRNTIWSNGLHQFVQLKHNVRLTFESMTSSFISNIGYIHKYKDKNIFGMTGTLGSRAEQELLSHMYNVSYGKIPTFKPKQFQELSGVVVDDEDWSDLIALNALEKVDEKRAVLVICETEKDVYDIEQNLKFLKKQGEETGTNQNDPEVKIRKYANEDEAEETKNEVHIGHIILATNIAGRGTNFKTTKNLEKNGGLHVCVGFLPYNMRVEQQAFGRTSRQGNKGTAELFIRQSEVDELNIKTENPSFQEIKNARDSLEKQRLDEIDKVMVKEINFKDELFLKFSKYQSKWKKDHKEQEDVFVLRDFRESWAFWLDKKNFKAKNIAATVEQEFQNFLSQAENIIRGQISHNPYYCVALADYFLQIEELDKAAIQLNRAIELNGNVMMAGAYLKLFEVKFLQKDLVWEKIRIALQSLISLSSSSSKVDNSQIISCLISAKQALGNEIDYIEKNLSSANPDFERIIVPKEKNLFLQHIYSRLYLLKIHYQNVVQLIDSLAGGDSVELSGKVLTDDESLNLKKYATDYEIRELHLSAVSALYSTQKLNKISGAALAAASILIGGGIAVWAIGFVFPPFYPIAQGIGVSLITEGIIDLVIALLNQGEFDLKDYLKEKAISFGIDIITFGISKLLKITKIIKGIIKFWRSVSSFLKNSKHFTKWLQKAASKIDDLIKKKELFYKFKYLKQEKRLEYLKYWEKTDAEAFKILGGKHKLTKLQNLSDLRKLKGLKSLEWRFFKPFAKKLGTTLAEKLTERVIIPQVFKCIMKKFCEDLKEELKKSIRDDPVLCDTITDTPSEKTKEVVEAYLKTDEVKSFFENLGEKVLGLTGNTFVSGAVYLYKIARSLINFDKVKKGFKKYLNENLPGGKSSNNLEEVLEETCSSVVTYLYNQLLEIAQGSFTFAKDVSVKHVWPVIYDKWQKSRQVTTLALYKVRPPPHDLLQDYKTLGLDENGVTLSDLNRNYRLAALKLHPDKNPDDPEATENFQKMQAAYERVKKNMFAIPDEPTNIFVSNTGDGTTRIE